jgi:xylulokinase
MHVTSIGTGNMARGIGSRVLAGGHTLTVVGKQAQDTEAVAAELAGGDGSVKTAVAGDPIEGEVVVLSAPAGAEGLVVVPYLEGERTPNRPHATGAIHGLTLITSSPAHLARATIEGRLCGLADGLDALVAQGVRVDRVLLIGGGARSEAVRRIAPAILGHPTVVPPLGEDVADGAARQAAWTLFQTTDPLAWGHGGAELHEADPMPFIRHQYAQVRELTATQPPATMQAPTNID